MATQRTEALRPDPERGTLVAAAVTALTLTVLVINSRFEDEWGQGIHFLYTALAAAVVIGMAAGSARPAGGEDRPATWQSALFVASFVLFIGTLSTLADILGSDGVFESPGTTVWVGLLTIGLLAWFVTGWNSGISTLLAAVTLAVVVVSFVDWVFDPEDTDTFRWILLLIALGFMAVGLSRRRTEPHHAVGWMNAAGLAVLAIALTFAFEAFAAAFTIFGDGGSSFESPGTGWELVVLAGGAILIGYSVNTAQAGPGYLGVANLLAFAALAASPSEDGPSLIGWPIVLLLITVALFAISRRNGGTAAGVPVRPGPDPHESPTAVQPRP